MLQPFLDKREDLGNIRSNTGYFFALHLKFPASIKVYVIMNWFYIFKALFPLPNA